MSDQTQSAPHRKIEAAIVGILIAGVMGFAVAKETGVIDGYLAKRSIGVIFGLMLVLMGNFLPKITRPMSAQASNPAKAMAAERFAGRVFVLGGIAYAAVWIFGPQESAPLISSLTGLGAFGLAAANWLRLMGAELFRNQREPGANKKHQARLQILFALFWVFAIFFADSIWGDHVAQPMAIVYAIVIIPWMAVLANRKRTSK